MTQAAKRRPRKLPDSYFSLVREFPLTCIRNDAHLDAATAMIKQLLQTRLDRGGEEYLDALSDLIEVYEDEHYPMPELSPPEALQGLMEEHGLTQAALAEKTGIAQSTILAVLAGKRELTAPQMRALGKVLAVDPSLFLRP